MRGFLGSLLWNIGAACVAWSLRIDPVGKTVKKRI